MLVYSFGMFSLSQTALEKIIDHYGVAVEHFEALDGIVDKLAGKSEQVLVFVQTDDKAELADIIESCLVDGKKIFVRVGSLTLEEESESQDEKADFVIHTPVQISLIAIVLLISSVLIEIPLGIIADRWSRKGSMVLAGLFLGVA